MLKPESISLASNIGRYLNINVVSQNVLPLIKQFKLDPKTITIEDDIILSHILNAMGGDIASTRWLFENYECYEKLLKSQDIINDNQDKQVNVIIKSDGDNNVNHN
jgi:hypothetical protein